MKKRCRKAGAVGGFSRAHLAIHLACTGKYPVDATYLLTARQVSALKALVAFVNAHPALFATTCTVTI